VGSAMVITGGVPQLRNGIGSGEYATAAGRAARSAAEGGPACSTGPPCRDQRCRRAAGPTKRLTRQKRNATLLWSAHALCRVRGIPANGCGHRPGGINAPRVTCRASPLIRATRCGGFKQCPIPPFRGRGVRHEFRSRHLCPGRRRLVRLRRIANPPCGRRCRGRKELHHQAEDPRRGQRPDGGGQEGGGERYQRIRRRAPRRGDGLPHRSGDRAGGHQPVRQSPPKGSAWACRIDGQPCRNRGSVGLNADVTIERKTVPAK
jgi:hypothetical protein